MSFEKQQHQQQNKYKIPSVLFAFAFLSSFFSLTSAFLLPISASSSTSTSAPSYGRLASIPIHTSTSTSKTSSNSFKLSSSTDDNNNNESIASGSYPYNKKLVEGLALNGIDNSPKADDPPLRVGHGYDIHRLEPFTFGYWWC